MEVPDKTEPKPKLEMQYVFDSVAEYIHKKGEIGMDRVMESGQEDWTQWPVVLHLDIVLKMLLNGLGEAQKKNVELQQRIEILERGKMS